MAWKIEYTQTAKDQLKKLDRAIAKRILDYLDTQIAPLEDAQGEKASGQIYQDSGVTVSAIVV